MRPKEDIYNRQAYDRVAKHDIPGQLTDGRKAAESTTTQIAHKKGLVLSRSEHSGSFTPLPQQGLNLLVGHLGHIHAGRMAWWAMWMMPWLHRHDFS